MNEQISLKFHADKFECNLIFRLICLEFKVVYVTISHHFVISFVSVMQEFHANKMFIERLYFTICLMAT